MVDQFFLHSSSENCSEYQTISRQPQSAGRRRSDVPILYNFVSTIAMPGGQFQPFIQPNGAYDSTWEAPASWQTPFPAGDYDQYIMPPTSPSLPGNEWHHRTEYTMTDQMAPQVRADCLFCLELTNLPTSRSIPMSAICRPVLNNVRISHFQPFR